MIMQTFALKTHVKDTQILLQDNIISKTLASNIG